MLIISSPLCPWSLVSVQLQGCVPGCGPLQLPCLSLFAPFLLQPDQLSPRAPPRHPPGWPPNTPLPGSCCAVFHKMPDTCCIFSYTFHSFRSPSSPPSLLLSPSPAFPVHHLLMHLLYSFYILSSFYFSPVSTSHFLGSLSFGNQYSDPLLPVKSIKNVKHCQWGFTSSIGCFPAARRRNCRNDQNMSSVVNLP